MTVAQKTLGELKKIVIDRLDKLKAEGKEIVQRHEALNRRVAKAEARDHDLLVNITSMQEHFEDKVRELHAGHTELGNLLVKHGEAVDGHEACLQRIEREDRAHLVAFKQIREEVGARMGIAESSIPRALQRVDAVDKKQVGLSRGFDELMRTYTRMSERLEGLEARRNEVPVWRRTLARALGSVGSRFKALAWQIGGSE